MKIKALPTKFIELYKLTNKATSDGFIYIKIQMECMAFHRQAFLLKNSSKNA
jgi:hypothetical protein